MSGGEAHAKCDASETENPDLCHNKSIFFHCAGSRRNDSAAVFMFYRETSILVKKWLFPRHLRSYIPQPH
jgi:hypothetical protein